MIQGHLIFWLPSTQDREAHVKLHLRCLAASDQNDSRALGFWLPATQDREAHVRLHARCPAARGGGDLFCSPVLSRFVSEIWDFYFGCNDN